MVLVAWCLTQVAYNALCAVEIALGMHILATTKSVPMFLIAAAILGAGQGICAACDYAVPTAVCACSWLDGVQ
ncbi:hypothetical protein AB0I53_43125 [Saccharopolyspora sp. NPDC050389]|uniref:hypothetical protein n=1 Tax=Saccharopolyspora sp. NPDC050389 TaxID=3155516 RepID=UPI0033DDF01C